MKVHRIQADKWAQMSETFHAVVFGQPFADSSERIDYALTVTNAEQKLIGYSTVREETGSVAYMQYGGALPEKQNTASVWWAYKELVDWLAERYDVVTTRIENTNLPMLRIATKVGFLITGVRTWDGRVLLELQRRPD